MAVLKSIAHRYVMADPQRQDLQTRQRDLLAELVGALLDAGADALDRGFAERFRAADSDAQRLRVVVDQVALFTDAQAVTRHRRILGR